jgi:2-polyprenyl-3-methyl-5-hydroxy-6-metoxy-1,4-benzoquinol methylase
MDPDLIQKITNQFNSDERIQAMLQSYGLKPIDGTVEVDNFELPREDFFFELTTEYLKSGRILDVGCGFGHLVYKFLNANYDARGLDLSESLIKIGQEFFHIQNIESARLMHENLFDLDIEDKYDAITACGVIWYYDDKKPFLDKLNSLLNKAGLVIIAHRNDLFNIYALNEGTINFFEDHFIDHLSSQQKDEFHNSIKSKLPELSAPIQKHVSSKLKRKYENPFDIHKLYQESGFMIKEIGYTYIHPTPPRFKIEHQREAYPILQKKYGRNWRGMFMGSQFVVIAEKQ